MVSKITLLKPRNMYLSVTDLLNFLKLPKGTRYSIKDIVLRDKGHIDNCCYDIML
jgi:hypothetical protein